MTTKTQSTGLASYRRLWRWHFYAGLFAIPFVLLLSITGAIYLFKPQIEAWQERSFEHLQLTGTHSLPSQQVAAALAAVPGSVLNAYQLPATPQSATRVLVGKGDTLYRVYVRPDNLQVLATVAEDSRLMRVLFHLHGELLLGDRGSMLVELAASWTIVLLLTGLYLWWPRQQRLAGILYPRLQGGKRLFWRDLHAVTGFWISFLALFLLLSGLPWAKSWGGMLKSLRQINLSAPLQQDWTTGRSSELAERRAANASAMSGMHEHGQPGMMVDYSPLDRLVPSVAPLNLAAPVLIAPPSHRSPHWTARSDAQNRPLRTTLQLNPATGDVLKRTDFSQRPLLDRIIGIGVAAHEGQLFGWLNQLLGVLTAAGLVLVSVGGVIMWWRRRRPGTLGAPTAAVTTPRLAGAMVLFIVLLGILLPLLGLSLIAVLLLERTLLRHLPAASRFLGLASQESVI